MLRDKSAFDLVATDGFKFQPGRYSIDAFTIVPVTGRYGHHDAVLMHTTNGYCGFIPNTLARNVIENRDELIDMLKARGSITLVLETRRSRKYNKDYIDGYFE